MATCRSCGAEIIWAKSRKTGKRIPIDREPVSDGNLKLTTTGTDGPLWAEPIKDDHRISSERYFKTHFATCPEAKTWRREERRTT